MEDAVIPKFEDSFNRYKKAIEKVKKANNYDELAEHELLALNILRRDLLILVNQLHRDLEYHTNERRIAFVNEPVYVEGSVDNFHDEEPKVEKKPAPKKKVAAKKAPAKKKSAKKAKK